MPEKILYLESRSINDIKNIESRMSLNEYKKRSWIVKFLRWIRGQILNLEISKMSNQKDMNLESR